MKLKIPPVLVLIFFGMMMWGISKTVSVWVFRSVEMAIVCVLAGGVIALLGVMAFRKTRTTVNPLKPEESSEVVSGGIYRFTRNPMYLGMALLLIGWGFYLGEIVSWVGIIGFVVYITHFQIIPEEEILTQKFGKTYQEYCQKTRRWL